jgi:hypothetical protein
VEQTAAVHDRPSDGLSHYERLWQVFKPDHSNRPSPKPPRVHFGCTPLVSCLPLHRDSDMVQGRPLGCLRAGCPGTHA